MAKSLIFGIGLNKTGTVSLTSALGTLGFPCLHDAPRVGPITTENREARRPLLHSLDEKYIAFCDYPICVLFRELDADYPGSKFIYTVRPLKPWIRSRMIQFGGTVEYHTEVAADHAVEVAAYFADRRDDILVYDLCGGDGWAPLCQFLGVSMPGQQFPRKNTTTPRLRRRRQHALRRRRQRALRKA